MGNLATGKLVPSKFPSPWKTDPKENVTIQNCPKNWLLDTLSKNLKNIAHRKLAQGKLTVTLFLLSLQKRKTLPLNACTQKLLTGAYLPKNRRKLLILLPYGHLRLEISQMSPQPKFPRPLLLQKVAREKLHMGHTAFFISQCWSTDTKNLKVYCHTFNCIMKLVISII